ncbi:cell division protein SepF [Bacillus carboniphilus]|uniref:Cell division protein SepF n=1 Tax=Bacillus carboniphilus TaxID=86663 RepID=A0ABY9JW30_9BACI|nr:cell division protein SepF [Bacillus carboniphilus]WLR43612.1 cell division protein SepF [Bacillus carboniphilus]
MSMRNKFRSFFALDDDEYEYVEEYIDEEDEYEGQLNQQKSNKQNVVSLQSLQKSSKVVLSEPRSYAEAQEVADELKNRRAVVVNLQRIKHDQAKRIVDFLSGTVYAIGGDIQRIGVDIFLCTPENVEVAGSITDYIQEEEKQRW